MMKNVVFLFYFSLFISLNWPSIKDRDMEQTDVKISFDAGSRTAPSCQKKALVKLPTIFYSQTHLPTKYLRPTPQSNSLWLMVHFSDHFCRSFCGSNAQVHDLPGLSLALSLHAPTQELGEDIPKGLVLISWFTWEISPQFADVFTTFSFLLGTFRGWKPLFRAYAQTP